MNFVALVPLRGGSKSIPFKNIKKMAGRPMCFWSISATLQSGCFSKVCVSTDSEEIKKVIVDHFGKAVDVIDRPAEFAQDTSSTESVMKHFASVVDFDVLCTIQATSPLVTPEDFRRAQKTFKDEKCDSLFTGCEFKRFIWDYQNKPLNYDFMKRPRRQQFQGQIIENGAFYFTKKELWTETENRLGGKIGHVLMAEESMFELDEPTDWLIIESLLKNRSAADIEEKIQEVKAIVLDVDGTLTDAGMYYGPEGEMLKKFNTRDAKGLELVRQAGIQVCVITAEDSASVHQRMKKLNISDYFYGVKDKLPVLKKWASDQGLSLKQIAYGGDDLGDLDCLQSVGFSFCPADSEQDVLAHVDYICTKVGGSGAVREVCNLLVNAQ